MRLILSHEVTYVKQVIVLLTGDIHTPRYEDKIGYTSFMLQQTEIYKYLIDT